MVVIALALAVPMLPGCSQSGASNSSNSDDSAQSASTEQRNPDPSSGEKEFLANSPNMASDIEATARSRAPYSDAGLRNAYKAKLDELIETYGEPQIEKNDTATYATGVVYAEVLDFGADNDYLLVSFHDPAYDKDPEQPAAYPESYRVEVWAYNGSKLENVYSGAGGLAG